MRRRSALGRGSTFWVLSWCLVSVCRADTVVLKNGDRLTGEVQKL